MLVPAQHNQNAHEQNPQLALLVSVTMAKSVSKLEDLEALEFHKGLQVSKS